jgi:hypothetical protein
LKVKELRHPESKTLQLLENTYKWLGEISSGVSILASSDASTQSVKLTYQYEYGDNTTSNYSSLNVGSLSIFIECGSVSKLSLSFLKKYI